MTVGLNLGQEIDQLFSVVDQWNAPGHSIEFHFPNEKWSIQFTWNTPNFGIPKKVVVDLTNYATFRKLNSDPKVLQEGFYKNRIFFKILLPQALLKENRDKLIALRDKIDSKAEHFMSADKRLIEARDRPCKAILAFMTISLVAFCILKQSNCQA